MVRPRTLEKKVRNMKPRLSALLAAVLAASTAGAASAASVTFTGSSGDLAASAVFNVVGGNLQITLTNTATVHTGLEPSEILTTILWDSLSPLNLNEDSVNSSVVVAGGSTIAQGVASPVGTNISKEYAYNDALSGAPGNATYGVAAAGMGTLFGSSQTFDNGGSLNPNGGTAPNGLSGGLVPAGFVNDSGNGGVDGRSLIRNSIVITLAPTVAGSLASFDPLAQITNVRFMYGTGLGEPTFPGDGPPVRTPPVPLPAAAWSGLSILGALGAYRLRRRA
jgi:hypothetical protein